MHCIAKLCYLGVRVLTDVNELVNIVIYPMTVLGVTWVYVSKRGGNDMTIKNIHG